MLGANLQSPPQVPGGPASAFPAASPALAQTLFFNEDSGELFRCTDDGSAWVQLVGGGGGGGGGGDALATGTVTVSAGTTTASIPHGLVAPTVWVSPHSDDFGARWWYNWDATTVTVFLDHAQVADTSFTWVGGTGSTGIGVGSIPAVDIIPGVDGDVLETVGGFAVWSPGATDFRYVHSQGSASATWNIPHNLGGFPNVSVVDSANTKVEGGVRYVDANNIQLSFSAPFSGQAYLS